MSLSIARTIILVLTPVFLLALTTNAMSLSWCFGKDGHSEKINFSSDDCCTAYECNKLVISSSQIDLERKTGCDSCIDIYIAKDSAISQRPKNQSFQSFHTIANTIIPSPKVSRNISLHSSSIGETVPRISLAILAHRTIVMLN